MIAFIQIILLMLLLVLAVPVLLFSFQIFFSLFAFRGNTNQKYQQTRPSVAVLIPAHNEQVGIISTLKSIKPQLLPTDQLIVVADNCNDSTAAVAKAHGAYVIERTDTLKRGKSYALDFGIRHLEKHVIPEVVIVIDADCIAAQNCISLLARQVQINNRPVQSLNLMFAPKGAGLKLKIAEFAWAVKNHARTMGYYKLGLPCQLQGTGMAFPWEAIRSANIASGHIVEDLKLGLELARQGKAPLFCPDALVTSFFPLNDEGIKTQRTRWEHGHLAMIVKEGPVLLFKSIVSKNIPMLFLALDMCVPPLALLAITVLLLTFMSLIFAILSHVFLPLILVASILGVFGIAVFLAWFKFGRTIISFSNLAYIPFYMVAKIPLYIHFFVKRQVEWVRSKRDD